MLKRSNKRGWEILYVFCASLFWLFGVAPRSQTNAKAMPGVLESEIVKCIYKSLDVALEEFTCESPVLCLSYAWPWSFSSFPKFLRSSRAYP